jgi:hypothetical protein
MIPQSLGGLPAFPVYFSESGAVHVSRRSGSGSFAHAFGFSGG